MSNVEIDQLRERLLQQEITIGFMGAIGAGKSFVAERISQRLGIKIFTESYQKNPYLDDFYSDPKRWSFHSQVFFLQDAVRQEANSGNNGGGIKDPAFAMHTDVFARVQHEIMGWMDERSYQTYLLLKEFLKQGHTPKKPDVNVLVNAPFKILTQRIRQRGRPYELRMLEHYPQYLMAIQSYVRVWRRENPQENVIVINTHNQDVSKETVLDAIELQILNACLANK